MLYNYTMQATFESEKNKKAFIYTVIICGSILLLSIFIKWDLTKPYTPVIEDLIEVNLGNDAEGYGDVQPLVKGEMGPAKEEAIPKSEASTSFENTVEPEDDKEEAAPVTNIKKNPTPKVSTTPTINSKKTNTNQVVANPSPKPKTPTSIYKGPGNGTGNNAEVDNGYKYQGNNPSGKGDAGIPTGNPDSYGNNPGGKTGVSVTKGVRPLNIGSLRFEDNFNQNAKVYLDVKYNSGGSVISSAVAKGSTTSNSTIISIAKRKAADLKFPSSEDGGISTILFNFRIQQ
jgi:hypothetical protein